MDLGEFFGQTNVVVVVGKGGVGKTTLTAALGLAAARTGLRVLLCALDDSGGLPQLFGGTEALRWEERELWHDPARPRAAIEGRLITSDAALIEYLASHGLRRVSHRLVHNGALEVVSTAIPGIREVLVLGKLKQLERSGAYDLIVLDAPATGHAVSFLTSSGGLYDAARGGPLQRQAEEVVALLSDPSRCQVLLATLAEETPVNEVIETAFRLEDEVGVALLGVVVNACYRVLPGLAIDPERAARDAGVPEPRGEELDRLRAAAAFREARQDLQRSAIGRLAAELPLPQLRLPYLFSVELGTGELEELADALIAEIGAL